MFIADLKNNLFSQCHCLNGSLTFVVITSCKSHFLSSEKLVLPPCEDMLHFKQQIIVYNLSGK